MRYYGPNGSRCLDWGVGGQPNLGNAFILGLSGPATPPLLNSQTNNVLFLENDLSYKKPPNKVQIAVPKSSDLL